MLYPRMFCVASFIASVLLATVLYSSEINKDQSTNKVLPAAKNETKFDISDFEYKSEGKRDPFEAVLLNKMTKTRTSSMTSKTKKEEEDKVGYELESLKLVGVLKSDNGMMAMMEDSQGKGVFFRKGDQLNNRIGMWVADISNSNVVFAYKLKGEIKKVVVDLPKK